MRLPGSIEFASRPIKPYELGVFSRDEKSSISLFSKKPAPSTTIFEPNDRFSVVVYATALPAASITDRCVVCGLSCVNTPGPMLVDGLARVGSKSAKRVRAYGFAVSSTSGTG